MIFNWAFTTNTPKKHGFNDIFSQIPLKNMFFNDASTTNPAKKFGL